MNHDVLIFFYKRCKFICIVHTCCHFRPKSLYRKSINIQGVCVWGFEKPQSFKRLAQLICDTLERAMISFYIAFLFLRSTYLYMRQVEQQRHGYVTACRTILCKKISYVWDQVSFLLKFIVCIDEQFKEAFSSLSKHMLQARNNHSSK